MIGLSGLSRFLVQGPISLKTEHVKVQYFNWYLFYFILTLLTGNCSVTQHLAAFSKTLFTKVLFLCTKCTKIVFVLGQDSTPDPTERERYYAPPDRVDWEWDTQLPFSNNIFSVLMSYDYTYDCQARRGWVHTFIIRWSM